LNVVLYSCPHCTYIFRTARAWWTKGFGSASKRRTPRCCRATMPCNGVIKFKPAHASSNMTCYWSVDKHFILAPEYASGKAELEYFVALLWLNGKLSCGKVMLKADKMNTFVHYLRHFFACASLTSLRLNYVIVFSVLLWKLRKQTETLFLVSHHAPRANAVNQHPTGKACAFLHRHKSYARITASKRTRDVQPRKQRCWTSSDMFFPWIKQW